MVEGEGREGSQGEAVSGDARRASSRRGRRASRPSMEYDVPDSYQNLDELAGPPPVQNPDENVFRRVSAREDDLGAADAAVRPSGAPRRLSRARRRSSAARVDYEMPETYANLDELGPSPVQNPDENPHLPTPQPRGRLQPRPGSHREPRDGGGDGRATRRGGQAGTAGLALGNGGVCRLVPRLLRHAWHARPPGPPGPDHICRVARCLQLRVAKLRRQPLSWDT